MVELYLCPVIPDDISVLTTIGIYIGFMNQSGQLCIICKYVECPSTFEFDNGLCTTIDIVIETSMSLCTTHGGRSASGQGGVVGEGERKNEEKREGEGKKDGKKKKKRKKKKIIFLKKKKKNYIIIMR